MKQIVLLFFWLFGASIPLLANKIDRGFLALKVYNYFEAKNMFEKGLKKDSSAAAYGLAVIYYRHDNPFHNLDSAYKYIQIAEQGFQAIKIKTQKRYELRYQFTYLAIVELRRQVSSAFYANTRRENSLSAWNTFLDRHPWALEKNQAIRQRDSLAYELLLVAQRSDSMQVFLDRYPTSHLREAAQHQFYLLQYREQVPADNEQVLATFILQNYANVFVGEAEDRLYEMITAENSVEAYTYFIRTYPRNRNNSKAWKNLYQRFMFDYSEDRGTLFLERYPDYPYREVVLEDIQLASQVFLPFRRGNLFGMMNVKGEIEIDAQYEVLSFFSEGLALATKQGKVGYIDKRNKVVIPFVFDAGTDFENGRAQVEQNGKVGIIDRLGNFVFEVKYQDLGPFSEGLLYASEDGLYGYYDRTGAEIIPPLFEEAFSFTNGLAKVVKNGSQAFINPRGELVVPPLYESVRFFNDSMLLFEQAGLFGIMRITGAIVLQPEYQQIGELTGNRVLCVKNGKVGYLDSVGNVVIPCQFEMMPNLLVSGKFVRGVAKVKSKGKFGLIDSFGKWVIEPTYQDMGQVATWIAFQKGKAWGFLNQKNKVVLQPVYEFAESFDGGLAIVTSLGKKGVIDNQGNFVIVPQFEDIKRLDAKRYQVFTGMKYGVFSAKGQQLVPTNYTQIRTFNQDFLLLTNDEEVHYFHLASETLIIPKMNE